VNGPRHLRYLRGRLSIATIALLAMVLMSAGVARAALPDQRGYELVNEPDKLGSSVSGATLSNDGQRVMYVLLSGGAESPSGALSLVNATREQSGWKRESALPPSDQLLAPMYSWPLAHTPDLSQIISSAGDSNTLRALSTAQTLVRLGNGSQQALATMPAGRNDVFDQVSMSDDGVHVFVNSLEPFDPNDLGNGNVYDIGSGTPVLVSRLPGGSVPACGVPTGGRNAGFAGKDNNATPMQHWISTDGTRVIFRSEGDTCGDPRQIYMRDTRAGRTTLISGAPTSGSPADAFFVQATPDLSAVLFLSAANLVAGDTNDLNDLYRWTAATGDQCITCIVPAATVRAVNLAPLVAAAQDLSRIYFVSREQLVPGEGTAGINNLYIWHVTPTSGPAGRIDYVSAGTDRFSSDPRLAGQITPDGRVLVFRASDPAMNGLTDPPSDNGGFFQYYRYDDGNGSLTCVSCPASGPAGQDVAQGLNQPVYNGVVYNRVLTDDGRMFFFRTTDPLVPQDVNGTDDIYEWEAQGTGGCEKAPGCVSLISDGVSVHDVLPDSIIGTSPTGSDFYFMSYSALTPDVADHANQLYDARIEGGIRFPTPTPPCDSEQCQGQFAPPPPFSDPGSALTQGDDVVAAARIALAKVTAAQRRALARTGRLSLAVKVTAAGAVSVVARAKVAGHLRTVAHGSAAADGPGTVKVPLQLSRAARRALARKGALRIGLTVDSSTAADAARGSVLVRARGARRAHRSSVPATAHGR
jgi:hypothetical protein